MVKKDLNVLLVRKMIKRLNYHTYFSQKWHHIEMTLMKLNIYFFNIKDDELLENTMKFGKR